jgi:hypothetical protein
MAARHSELSATRDLLHDMGDRTRSGQHARGVPTPVHPLQRTARRKGAGRAGEPGAEALDADCRDLAAAATALRELGAM